MRRHLEKRVDARANRSAVGICIAFAALLLQGCDMCETGDLRCSGSVVEECNSNRNWEESHDCGADQCGVGREVCGDPWIPLSGGEVWCCYQPP